MTIAQHDIERQVAEAVAGGTDLPAPRVAQVVLIAQTQELATLMQREMALDAGVAGRVLTGTLTSVSEAADIDWAGVDFVVFEVSSDSAADLHAIQQLKGQPDAMLHCIAVSQEAVSDATAQLYTSGGAHEVLTIKPAAAPAVMEEVEVPPAQDPSADTGGQVTVFLRARGGAGATTMAVNMAASLAADPASGTTALIDLDIQNGAIALALDLPDSTEFAKLVQGNAAPNAAFLDRAMQVHSSGVHVMTAPDIFAPLTAITDKMVTDLIAALRTRYDNVIIDMPQSVVDWITPVLNTAARVIMVSDMTLPSLKRSKRLIDLIGEEHMTLPIQIVVNFEKRPMLKSAAHKEAEHLIGRSLDHWVPDDAKAARRAMDMGIPLVIGAKRSPASKAIAAFGTSIFSDKTEG